MTDTFAKKKGTDMTTATSVKRNSKVWETPMTWRQWAKEYLSIILTVLAVASASLGFVYSYDQRIKATEARSLGTEQCVSQIRAVVLPKMDEQNQEIQLELKGIKVSQEHQQGRLKDIDDKMQLLLEVTLEQARARGGVK